MSRKEKIKATLSALAIGMSALCLGLLLGAVVFNGITGLAQNAPSGAQSPPTSVSTFTPYPITPLTATAAVANATTISIPAPPSGWFNYVCYLALEGSNDNTATAVSNATTSSTNFGGFAEKLSVPSSASNDTGVLVYLNSSPPGCAKSAAAATATTFVSPNSTHEAYTWTATYFQAP